MIIIIVILYILYLLALVGLFTGVNIFPFWLFKLYYLFIFSVDLFMSIIIIPDKLLIKTLIDGLLLNYLSIFVHISQLPFSYLKIYLFRSDLIWELHCICPLGDLFILVFIILFLYYLIRQDRK